MVARGRGALGASWRSPVEGHRVRRASEFSATRGASTAQSVFFSGVIEEARAEIEQLIDRKRLRWCVRAGGSGAAPEARLPRAAHRRGGRRGERGASPRRRVVDARNLPRALADPGAMLELTSAPRRAARAVHDRPRGGERRRGATARCEPARTRTKSARRRRARPASLLRELVDRAERERARAVDRLEHSAGRRGDALGGARRAARGRAGRAGPASEADGVGARQRPLRFGAADGSRGGGQGRPHARARRGRARSRSVASAARSRGRRGARPARRRIARTSAARRPATPSRRAWSRARRRARSRTFRRHVRHNAPHGAARGDGHRGRSERAGRKRYARAGARRAISRQGRRRAGSGWEKSATARVISGPPWPPAWTSKI